MSVYDIQTLLALPQEERESVRLTSQTLAGYADQPLHIRIDERGTTCELPASVVKVLSELMQAMAEGQSLAILPLQTELNLQQAAEVLDVSVPYLVKLLDENEIPSRREGIHRLVKLHDLLDYDKRSTEEREEVLAKLVLEGQRLNMGY